MQLEPSIQLLDRLLKLWQPTHQLSLPAIAQRNAEPLDGGLAWRFLG